MKKLLLLALILGASSGALADTPLTLAWTPGTDGAIPEGYQIAYGDAPGVYPTLIDAGKGTPIANGEVSYSIPIWDFSKIQYIVVRAYNAAGSSGDSNEVAAGKPLVPTGFSCLVVPVDESSELKFYKNYSCFSRETICLLEKQNYKLRDIPWIKCMQPFRSQCSVVITNPFP